VNSAQAPGAGLAVVTPSFARDFALCRDLNESVLRFIPEPAKHYLIVDARDLALFRSLEGRRTVVVAVEDVIPKGYAKLPFSKRWWFSTAAMVPAKGWLIQQLVKLSAARAIDAPLLLNVDSDVRFVRPVDPALFARNGLTRLYRKPGGIIAGMHHAKWHRNVCRLLDVPADALPMNDYVGNVISWKRALVLDVCARIEAVAGVPWHVAFARGRLVSEYLAYGLYVDKVLGREAAGVWIDERSWCHTYWGPQPLPPSEVEAFVAAMPPDDVAFSIAGYTGTEPEVARRATTLALRLAGAA
jgi:hypothetical protein